MHYAFSLLDLKNLPTPVSVIFPPAPLIVLFCYKVLNIVSCNMDINYNDGTKPHYVAPKEQATFALNVTYLIIQE